MSDTQQQEPQENSHHLLLVALFALSMIVLLVSAILFIAPEIEKDLNQKITEELEKKGIEATVSLSGRDVTLSGNVATPEEMQQAQSAIDKVCGIHFVDNQLIPRTGVTTLDNTTSSIAKKQENITQPIEKTSIKQNNTEENKNNENNLATTSSHNETQTNSFIDFDTSVLHFKNNTNTLTARSKKALVTLAEILKKDEKTIEIIVSATASNLGFKRAKEIQLYLIKQGLKRKNLIVIGRTNNTKDKVTIKERTN